MTRAFSTLRSGSGDGAPAAISQAVRQAGRFDSSAVSLRDGLVAAIPVVVLLAAGTAAGDPVAAVTMGAGAMLVGVAWRAGGGRPPLAAMATTTAVMGLSTFAGAASGQYAWLHFAIVAAPRIPNSGRSLRRSTSHWSGSRTPSGHRALSP